MLTVVWSPFKGQAGTTMAFCALSCYTAGNAQFGERTLMMRTKLKNSGITEVLDAARYGLSTAVQKREYQMSFEEATGDRSIDHLLMAYAAGFQLKDTLEANVLNLDRQLFVLEGSRSNCRDIYEKELAATIEKIIKVACFSFTEVFLEAEAGINSVNNKIFELADKIIVCIPQNTFALRELVKYALPEEKISFLIGNYDEESVLGAKNLSKQMKTECVLKGLTYKSGLKNAYSGGYLRKELEMEFADKDSELGIRMQEVLNS